MAFIGGSCHGRTRPFRRARKTGSLRLSAVVAHDHLRFAALAHQLVELAYDADSRNRHRQSGQAFDACNVDHDEHEHAAAINELISDEIN